MTQVVGFVSVIMSGLPSISHHTRLLFVYFPSCLHSNYLKALKTLPLTPPLPPHIWPHFVFIDVLKWDFKLFDQKLFHLGDVLIMDSSERRKAGESLGCPLFSDFGPRPSQREKSVVEWKLEHLQTFAGNDMDWPLDAETVQGCSSHIYRDGMFQREQEVCVFLDRVWPPRGDDPDFVFCDINPTLFRIVGQLLEEGTGKPKAQQAGASERQTP